MSSFLLPGAGAASTLQLPVLIGAKLGKPGFRLSLARAG
jgi:hypothetical protein